MKNLYFLTYLANNAEEVISWFRVTSSHPQCDTVSNRCVANTTFLVNLSFESKKGHQLKKYPSAIRDAVSAAQQTLDG